MRLLCCALLLFGAYVTAGEREKRQAAYQFPGPRSEGRQVDSGRYTVPQRQFQGQPVQAYSPPRGSPRRQAASGPKYGSVPQQSLEEDGDYAGEEERGPTTPDPLSLLLADSKFSCSGKNDGYYADDSVNCRAFHYCTGGVSHSWMCPGGTVFHQVHLNCVPSAQDICDRSEKFYVVNDYLYKTLDHKGPNQTARYYQRYYPEEFLLGPPAPNQFGFPAAPSSDYAGGASAARPAPQPTFSGGAPALRPASGPSPYNNVPAPRPAPRPSPYDNAPAPRPAPSPSPYDNAPAPRPAPRPSPYDNAPAPRPAPRPSFYGSAPESRPARRPSSYGSASVPRPAPRPNFYGGASVARPDPRPNSYDDTTPSRSISYDALKTRPVAYIPYRSSEVKPQVPVPHKPSSEYHRFPESPQHSQLSSIPQGPKPSQGGNDLNKRPIGYNPNIYGGPSRSRSASQNYGNAGVQYVDEYN
ncbi:vegetative cell wall protein gp1-like [Limulus polyphemus]|uniref:Vegetative cell wall protein gp1-like n=1 Tax=Limulus polyphemus TaxID=6850 RepID=A0ABM1TH48_LIMPO|nr:vegetative cell wall protein gp1-like [Limulus polyphemus]XP_022255204.1 vegetative cell wall protein gp1-like [Limulus polyphemus]